MPADGERYNNILRVAGASNSWEQSRGSVGTGSLSPSLSFHRIVPVFFPPSSAFSSFSQYEFNPKDVGNGARLAPLSPS